MNGYRVSDVMTKNVIYLQAETRIDEAARAMRDADIGDVVVTEGAELIGMVTDRDIVVRAIAEGATPAPRSARSSRGIWSRGAGPPRHRGRQAYAGQGVRRVLVCDARAAGGHPVHRRPGADSTPTRRSARSRTAPGPLTRTSARVRADRAPRWARPVRAGIGGGRGPLGGATAGARRPGRLESCRRRPCRPSSPRSSTISPPPPRGRPGDAAGVLRRGAAPARRVGRDGGMEQVVECQTPFFLRPRSGRDRAAGSTARRRRRPPGPSPASSPKGWPGRARRGAGRTGDLYQRMGLAQRSARSGSAVAPRSWAA